MSSRCMTNVLVVIFFLLIPSMALARLGDTEQDAITRYGNPSRQEQVAGFEKKISFEALPYTISLFFKGGRVAVINYQLVNKEKISLSKLERLLRYNGERENEPEGVELKNIWYLDGGTPGTVNLRDKAGKTDAVYDQTTNTLSVRSLATQQTTAPAQPSPAPKAKPAMAVKPTPAKAIIKLPITTNRQVAARPVTPAVKK